MNFDRARPIKLNFLGGGVGDRDTLTSNHVLIRMILLCDLDCCVI
jgi:hypothetical protein